MAFLHVTEGLPPKWYPSHSERAVKARGGLPITPGAIRYINGLPPRIPAKEMGKHRPEVHDDTFDFQLAIDFLETKNKSVRTTVGKILARLAEKMLTTPLPVR
jgi:hypothetical protein